jgi:hypothetical protein
VLIVVVVVLRCSWMYVGCEWKVVRNEERLDSDHAKAGENVN